MVQSNCWSGIEDGGIDAHKLTDPLWSVIENYMILLYGPESTRIILWYIYERIGPDGEIIPLETGCLPLLGRAHILHALALLRLPVALYLWRREWDSNPRGGF